MAQTFTPGSSGNREQTAKARMTTTDSSTPTTLQRNYPGLLILALVILLGLALRLAFIHEPFERDEGLYGYIGQELLRGAVLYRDVADLKPPGIFLIYALMIRICGSSLEAVRLLTALYATGTTLAVFALARRLTSMTGGLTAALLFAIFSSAPLMQGSSSNTEVFLLLPLTLSVYVFVTALDNNCRVLLLLSGLCAGIALLIKSVALPYLGVMTAFLLFRTSGGPWHRRFLDTALLLIPVAAIVALTITYFHLHDALQQFHYWNVRIFTRHYLHLDWQESATLLKESLSLLWEEQLLLWVAGLAGAIVLARNHRSPTHLVMVALLPAAVVGVAMPGHFIPHYYIQLTPICAILGGVFLAHLLARTGWHPRAAVFLLLLGLVLHFRPDYPYYVTYSPAEVVTHKYENFTAFAESVEIARYVKERTTPDDYILQWGWEPELYFYTNRRGLKHAEVFLFIHWAPNCFTAINEFKEELRTKKPAYIIVQNDDKYVPYSIFVGFGSVTKELETNYVLEREQGYARIYRRKQAKV